MAELVVLLYQPDAFQILGRRKQDIEIRMEWDREDDIFTAIRNPHVLSAIRKTHYRVPVLECHAREVKEISRPDHDARDKEDCESLLPIPSARLKLPSTRLQHQHQDERQ